MLRRLGVLGLVLMLAALSVAPVGAQQTGRYFLGVLGNNQAPITAGRCRVITAGTFSTDATIYTDANLTSTATNPIALDTTSGTCSWYLPVATTSVDVIVYVDSGEYAGTRVRVDGVTRTGAKTVTVTRHTNLRVLSIPFVKNTGTQTSTTKLPAGATVLGAEVEVTTAVASGTVSFGAASPFAVTSFCNAQSAAAAGFFVCPLGVAVDVGTTALALTYLTSNHSVAGYLNVYYSPNGGN